MRHRGLGEQDDERAQDRAGERGQRGDPQDVDRKVELELRSPYSKACRAGPVIAQNSNPRQTTDRISAVLTRMAVPTRPTAASIRSMTMLRRWKKPAAMPLKTNTSSMHSTRS
jgi:hypothetical protein